MVREWYRVALNGDGNPASTPVPVWVISLILPCMGFGARTTVQAIVTGIAAQKVIAGPTGEPIVPGTTGQMIIAAIPAQHIVAGAAEQTIAARTT